MLHVAPEFTPWSPAPHDDCRPLLAPSSLALEIPVLGPSQPEGLQRLVPAVDSFVVGSS